MSTSVSSPSSEAASTSSPSSAAIPPLLEAQTFEAFLSGRRDPDWLVAIRRGAFEQLQQTAFPTTRDEEWRRTDLRTFKLARFILPVEQPDAPTTFDLNATNTLSTLRESGSAGLATIDGVRTESGSSSQDHPDGVVFSTLDEALANYPELVRTHLSKIVEPGHDAFSLLQTAYFQGGTFLYVPRGVTLDGMLWAVHGLSESTSIGLGRTLIALEDGADATLITADLGQPRADGPSMNCGATEVHLGAGSRLRLVNIQGWNRDTYEFRRERVIIGRDARLEWSVAGLGSKLAKVNQEVVLDGPGSHAQVNGVLFTSRKQHLSYVTRQDHRAPQASSDLLYKGGLRDRSQIIWRGMIRVAKDAQKTDSYQRNDNLNLSEQAHAHSIPGLEIEADDVRCTHGATTSTVDPDMLFYAATRGIAPDQATRMIVEGFFADIYDRIGLEPVRDLLAEAVTSKLAESGDA